MRLAERRSGNVGNEVLSVGKGGQIEGLGKAMEKRQTRSSKEGRCEW